MCPRPGSPRSSTRWTRIHADALAGRADTGGDEAGRLPQCNPRGCGEALSLPLTSKGQSRWIPACAGTLLLARALNMGMSKRNVVSHHNNNCTRGMRSPTSFEGPLTSRSLKLQLADTSLHIIPTVPRSNAACQLDRTSHRLPRLHALPDSVTRHRHPAPPQTCRILALSSAAGPFSIWSTRARRSARRP